MSDDSRHPAATDAAAYRYWSGEHVRFADLDMLGHVNNVAFTVYAESGRVAFLRDIGFWRQDSKRHNVVVRLELDYRQELRYPGQLRLGLRVLNIGRSSFTLAQGMFDGERCAATAVAVLVRYDAQTRKAVALSADERALLLPYLDLAAPTGSKAMEAS